MTDAHDLEESYTSTGSKYLQWPERLAALRDGEAQPIVCHVMPTSKCNMACSYCSVKNRGNEELTEEQVLTFLGRLANRGLQSVIISGGGNPLLWEPLDRVILSAVNELGLSVGLITNGGTPDVWCHISGQGLDALAWIRLSLSAIDRTRTDWKDWLCMPESRNWDDVVFGASYIWHDQSDVLGGTTIERLRWVAEEIGPEYIRLLADCSWDQQDKVPERLQFLEGLRKRLGSPPFFAQRKLPAAPPRCWLGWLHPVLNTDGYVYPCDSLVLNPSADRQFHPNWRQCHMDDLDKWFALEPDSCVDTKMCPACVFTESNLLIDAAMVTQQHKEFP